MTHRIMILLSIFIILVGSIAAQEDDAITLTLVTHDSFSISEEVLSAFTEDTGIHIEVLRSGDAGQLVNQSILTSGNPLGDVLFGVDNTFLSRALNAGIFIPYESPLIEFVDPGFIGDEEFRVTPIDYGDVCINYDKVFFEEQGLDIPQSLSDLLDPQYEGMLVVENPATSSPGLAFLLATIAEFGAPELMEEGADADDYTYLTFWEGLLENGALIVEDWSSAYFGHFTQGSEDGTFPMVVSYASSPPFTYSEDLDDATTASIVAAGTCFRQIEFAGILEGSDHIPEAQQFIDFMLSVEFQEDVPFQMYVFPVNREATLPDLFAEYAQIAEEPALLDAQIIEDMREEWIETWIETILSQ